MCVFVLIACFCVILAKESGLETPQEQEIIRGKLSGPRKHYIVFFPKPKGSKAIPEARETMNINSSCTLLSCPSLISRVIESLMNERLDRRETRKRRLDSEGVDMMEDDFYFEMVQDFTKRQDTNPISSSSPAIDSKSTVILNGFVAILSDSAVRFLAQNERNNHHHRSQLQIVEDATVYAATIRPPIPIPHHTSRRLAPHSYPSASVSSPLVTNTSLSSPLEAEEAEMNHRNLQETIIATQSWGLDRIDQTMLPLDGLFHRSSAIDGTGVDVYVVDSGVRRTHQEFARTTISLSSVIVEGVNFVSDASRDNYDDCAGHGTHITGTIAGQTVGVAPGVSIIIVRIYGCDASGPLRNVLSGFEYITNRMAQNKGTPAIVNLSFATEYSDVLNEAVTTLADAGAMIVNAAGNTASNACQTSPASAAGSRNTPQRDIHPRIITVGSSDRSDGYSSYSDTGPCVSLSAPGRGIISSGIISDESVASMTGTSMATPHVTGALSLLLQQQRLLLPHQDSELVSPTLAQASLLNSARNHLLRCYTTNGRLLNLPAETPNLLLYLPNMRVLPSISACTDEETSSTPPSTTSTSGGGPTGISAIIENLGTQQQHPDEEQGTSSSSSSSSDDNKMHSSNDNDNNSSTAYGRTTSSRSSSSRYIGISPASSSVDAIAINKGIWINIPFFIAMLIISFRRA